MKIENLIIYVLAIVAVIGLVWTVLSFGKVSKSIKNTPENFNKAIQAELSDKCQTPEGYTDKDWYEHMSHHPDRYKECLTDVDPADLVKQIGPDELATILENEDITLVDVHTPEQPHIKGTDAFIPFDQIKNRVNELPKNKDAKIVLYCRSGSMSRRASEDLVEMGYTNVYDLVGGTNGWKQMGYDVEDISLQ